jgi:RNA polymerase sigma-70 factor (ECF subfamily)
MKQSREHTAPATSTDRNDRDRALFERYVAGDQTAFRSLYELYERSLILYCEYLMRTPQEAQDIFQETWLRVVRVGERGTRVENFRALLFTIARNNALTRLGNLKQAIKQNVPLDLLGPENAALSRQGEPFPELEELVQRALARLPVVQREAFVLHAVFGYTFQEIAEMQGSTMTAAKTRAFRARGFLRKLIGNWLGLAEDDTLDNEHTESLSPHLFKAKK